MMHEVRYSIHLVWQVSSALYRLRQRNNYPGSMPHAWRRPVTNCVDPSAVSTYDRCTSQPQESGFIVNEIIESSKIKARTMVDAAVQVHGQSTVTCVGILSKSSVGVIQTGFKMMFWKNSKA